MTAAEPPTEPPTCEAQVYVQGECRRCAHPATTDGLCPWHYARQRAGRWVIRRPYDPSEPPAAAGTKEQP